MTFYRQGHFYKLKPYIRSLFISKRTIDKYLSKCEFDPSNEKEVRGYLLAHLSIGAFKSVDSIRILNIFTYNA